MAPSPSFAKKAAWAAASASVRRVGSGVGRAVGAEVGAQTGGAVEGGLGDQAGGDQRRRLAVGGLQGVDQADQPGQAGGVAHHAGVAAHGRAQVCQRSVRQVGGGGRAQRPGLGILERGGGAMIWHG